jgi:predicted GIY-YIG superfamily endonuclease
MSYHDILKEYQFLDKLMDKTLPGVYILHHQQSGKVYVGSAKKLLQRLAGHMYHLRKGIHYNKSFQEAYNQSPTLEPVFLQFETRDEAFTAEQAILDTYYPQGVLFNYSINARASLKGMNHTEEARLKIGAASRARPFDPRQDAGRRKGLEASIDARSVPVEIEGVTYSSAFKAAEALGIRYTTVRYRLSSEGYKFKKWRYL